MALRLGQDGRERLAGEDVLQRRADLRLPAGAQRVVLQLREQRLDVGQPALPQRAHLAHQRQRLRHAVFQQFGRRNLAGVVLLAQRQVAAAEEGLQLVGQLDLVGQRQLDVDALDAVGVLGHARQRDHHVFVDLEGVGVLADGGRALAVQPELLARLGADGDEAFAAARIGDAHHFRGDARHGVGVVAGDVADQHHLGQHRRAWTWWRSPPPSGSGRPGAPGPPAATPERFCSANMKSLISTMLGTASRALPKNSRHTVRVCSGMRCTTQRRAGDQAVAAFLLDAGQAREELVGHVLAQAFLAEGVARDLQPLGAHAASCRRPAKYLQLEGRHRRRRGSCPGCGPGA